MATTERFTIEMKDEFFRRLEALRVQMGAKTHEEVIVRSVTAVECLIAADNGNYTFVTKHPSSPEKKLEIKRGPFEVKLTPTGR